MDKIKRGLAALASLRLLPMEIRRLQKISESTSRMQFWNTLAVAEAEYARIAEQSRRKDYRRLDCFGAKQLSQNDEDGIISEIFERIGTTNRTFIEFGVENGVENNSVSLLMGGWNGLWIDGNPEAHRRQIELFQHWYKSGDLRCVESMLTAENIDEVICSSGIQGEIDLLSIDVDGNDLRLWNAIRCVQPRVVVIEYNGWLAPPISWCLPYNPEFVWNGESIVAGASLQALADLAEGRGYMLVGCNIVGLNAFFVRSDLCKDLFASAGDTKDLYHPRRYWLDIIFKRNTQDVFESAMLGFRK